MIRQGDREWDVPFQVPMSICPRRLVPSFNLNGYDRLLHITKPYLCWIETFFTVLGATKLIQRNLIVRVNVACP